MITTPGRSPYSKPVRLAMTAYRAALAGKWDTARDALIRLDGECEDGSVTDALVMWCAAYVDHAAGGPAVIRTRSGMRFWETGSGALDGAGSPEVPADVRWAGNLIAAYASQDEEAFWDLIEALPDDDAEVGRYVVEVLRGVANAVNVLPRGWVWMGKGGAM